MWALREGIGENKGWVPRSNLCLLHHPALGKPAFCHATGGGGEDQGLWGPPQIHLYLLEGSHMGRDTDLPPHHVPATTQVGLDSDGHRLERR